MSHWSLNQGNNAKCVSALNIRNKHHLLHKITSVFYVFYINTLFLNNQVQKIHNTLKIYNILIDIRWTFSNDWCLCNTDSHLIIARVDTQGLITRVDTWFVIFKWSYWSLTIRRWQIMKRTIRNLIIWQKKLSLNAKLV